MLFKVFLFALLAGCGVGNAARYELKQDNKTCLLLESTISAEMQDKTIRQYGEATGISGSCGESESLLTLNFTKPNSGLLELRFMQKSGSVSLANVTLFNPNLSSFVGSPIRLSGANESYRCQSELKIPLSGDVANVIVKNTALQAFNVKNASFSKQVSACGEDKNNGSTTAAGSTTTSQETTSTQAPQTSTTANASTTTQAATTSTPTTATPTTPEPAAPLLNLTVTDANGTVCILMQMRARFFIGYNAKNGSRTADVPLPMLTKVSGTCGATSQVLAVRFNNDWRAQFVFAGGDQYTLSSIQLDYKENMPIYFPNAANPQMNHTVLGNTTFLKVSSGAYFTCDAKQTFKIGANVTMETQELKVQAFRKSNSTTEFTGSQAQCSDDLPVDNIVPIIVGAALAALVIIVLVAYIIGRRRQSGGGYQSV